MVSKKKESGQAKRPTEAQPDTERQPASWVQKYLDLADLLIRRRKHKRDRDDAPPKAA
jgi:hypothetical protein